MNRNDLDRMSVAELRKRAASLRLSGASRLRKSELVELLAGSTPAKRTRGKAAPAKAAKKSAPKSVAPKVSKKPLRGKAAPAEAAKKQVAKKSAAAKPDAGKTVKQRAVRASSVETGVASVSSVSPRLKRAFISRPTNGEQRAKASKYYLGVPESPDLDQGFDYPETYGENTIFLMVRDPYWLFAYWEFAPELRGELVAMIGEDALLRSRTVLRVYDVTGTDPEHALGHYDIDIAPEARNWYINVARVEREYCVDVGLIAPDGSFIVIARSNRVSLPPVGPSDSVDEEWVTIEALDELYVRIDARRGPTSGSGGWGSGGFGR